MSHYTGNDPAMVYTTVQQAGIQDARTEFRSVFCHLLSTAPSDPGQPSCNSWLRKFSDESAAASPGVPTPIKPSVDIVIVTGIFGQCLPTVPAFGDAVARLRQLGYAVSYAPVRGRAGSDENAEIIRKHVALHRERHPSRRAAIISYSKGTADIITALAQYPELASQIAAVISVAGAVNGSPLADKLGGLYEATLAKLPYPYCETGDGSEMRSISREYRLRWMSSNELPRQPQYFSIVAAPDSEHLSAIFTSMHAELGQIDPRNDGQLLSADAILPHSTLLGYANADHFGVALPFDSHAPVLSSTIINRNRYPRTAMLEASMYFVERALAAKKP